MYPSGLQLGGQDPSKRSIYCFLLRVALEFSLLLKCTQMKLFKKVVNQTKVNLWKCEYILTSCFPLLLVASNNYNNKKLSFITATVVSSRVGLAIWSEGRSFHKLWGTADNFRLNLSARYMEHAAACMCVLKVVYI